MSTDIAESSKDSSIGLMARKVWLLCLSAGLAALATGIVVLVWPGRTLVVLGVLFGIYLVANGAVEVVLSLVLRFSGGIRTLGIATGVLSIVVGVLCLRDELQSVLMLAVWIGLGWIISGMGRMVIGLSSSLPGFGWLVVSGVVLLFGGIALIAYPVDSVTALALVSGVWLIVIGISEAVYAIQIYRRAHRLRCALAGAEKTASS